MGKLYLGAVGITAYVAPCSRPAGGSVIRTVRNEDDGVLSGPLGDSSRETAGNILPVNILPMSRMGASVKRPRQFLLSLEKFLAACFLRVGGI